MSEAQALVAVRRLTLQHMPAERSVMGIRTLVDRAVRLSK